MMRQIENIKNTKSEGKSGKIIAIGLIFLEISIFGFFACIPVGNLRIFFLNFSLFVYVFLRLASENFVEIVYGAAFMSLIFFIFFIKKNVAGISLNTFRFNPLIEIDVFWLIYIFSSFSLGFILAIKAALNYPSPYRKKGLFNHVKFKIARRLSFNWTLVLPFIIHNFLFIFLAVLLRFLQPFLNLFYLLFSFKFDRISFLLGLVFSNFTLLFIMINFIVTDAIVDYNLLEFPLQYPLYQSDMLSKYLTKSLEDTIGKMINLTRKYKASLVVTIPNTDSKLQPCKKPEIYRFSVIWEFLFYKIDLACFKLRYDYFYEKKEETVFNLAIKEQINQKIKEINEQSALNLRYL